MSHGIESRRNVQNPEESASENLSGLPYLQSPLKRNLDRFLALSLFCGTNMLQILPFSYAALALFDPSSPIFFQQERISRGNPFNLLKLRTMQGHSKNPTIPNDPRVTKIGRLLRKTSIDELPQLFNVIKGDMSMVGPRPVREIEMRKLSSNTVTKELFPDWFRLYNQAPPGITGLAQITNRGIYGLSPEGWLERMKWDNYYVENATLAMDIAILLKTIPAVISGRGVIS